MTEEQAEGVGLGSHAEQIDQHSGASLLGFAFFVMLD